MRQARKSSHRDAPGIGAGAGHAGRGEEKDRAHPPVSLRPGRRDADGRDPVGQRRRTGKTVHPVHVAGCAQSGSTATDPSRSAGSAGDGDGGGDGGEATGSRGCPSFQTTGPRRSQGCGDDGRQAKAQLFLVAARQIIEGSGSNALNKYQYLLSKARTEYETGNDAALFNVIGEGWRGVHGPTCEGGADEPHMPDHCAGAYALQALGELAPADQRRFFAYYLEAADTISECAFVAEDISRPDRRDAAWSAILKDRNVVRRDRLRAAFTYVLEHQPDDTTAPFTAGSGIRAHAAPLRQAENALPAG